jgi:hypothetical protein
MNKMRPHALLKKNGIERQNEVPLCEGMMYCTLLATASFR